MSEGRTYHKYGECKKGTHNKYYEVEAVEQEDGTATWSFRWARIGQLCSKPKEGTTHSFGAAEQICRTQWARKKANYQEVTAMEALASAVQDLDERPNNGLPKVDLIVPCFHAGPSEKRLRQFCRKYLDKLNVIRASRNDLGFERYEKQIDTMLKQYCAEFKRIYTTRAHYAVEDNSHAHAAFRIFFEALCGETRCSVYGYFDGVGVR